MDEVNHVKLVVSLWYNYYVVHACFLLHDDVVFFYMMMLLSFT